MVVKGYSICHNYYRHHHHHHHGGQSKEKLIGDLRDGHRDVNKDDEAIIEQIKMEKSMVEQQLNNTEKQLEQLRAELMVCNHDPITL